MKLSEMTFDQAADVLIRIAEPVAAIMNDKELDKLINTVTTMKNPTELQQLAFLAFKVVPFLLSKHRRATYTIISALTGKSEDEVAKENAKVMAREIYDSYDQDLRDFFRWSKETPNE